MPPKTTRRYQHGDDTRRRILDAASQIAAERGYEGTSMSKIAARADVSMSSIYWHFADKDAVIAGVIQRSYDDWTDDGVAPRPAVEPGASRAEMIDAMRDDIVAALTRHPDFMRLGLMLTLEGRTDELTARAIYLDVRRVTLERLEATFARLFDAHDAGDARLARRLATLALSAADGLFIAHHVAPDDVDFDEAIDLLLGGVLDRALGRSDVPN